MDITLEMEFKGTYDPVPTYLPGKGVRLACVSLIYRLENLQKEDRMGRIE